MRARAGRWRIALLGALGLLLALGLVWGLARQPLGPPGAALAVTPSPAPQDPATAAAPPATTNPTPTALPPTPTSEPTATPGLLERFGLEPMPPRDYTAVVQAFRGLPAHDASAPTATPRRFAPGDSDRFWIGDADEARARPITATLRLQTEHVQMWLEEGLDVSDEALARSAAAFDEQIYPTAREQLGPEWLPGVDGDPRLVVLNAAISGAAGYFAALNEYLRAIVPFSNEREMFVMNVRSLTPGTDTYHSVLAHEFQHMTHWYQDANEDSWVNEGASELAEDLTGFPEHGRIVSDFLRAPDLQLTTWSNEDGSLSAHYGASYLWLRYLYEQLGSEALRSLIAHPENGMSAVEHVLDAAGEARAAEDLFADWLLANTLDDLTLCEGRYGYDAVETNAARETVTTYPFATETRVQQYAADYYELWPAGEGPLTLTFAGEPSVRLVPNAPFSGSYQWWSNRGDSGHSTLERTFDLSEVTAAVLSYQVWHDIEEGWDYAYLRASVDGGQTWMLLRAPGMREPGESANVLGPGYTGRSGVPAGETGEPKWVREEVDLSAFAGQQVLVRFDYITDDAQNRPGLCLDDFALEAIKFQDDVEAGGNGWTARGFLRHDNRLPQRWLLQLVELGAEPRVQRLLLDDEGQGEWRVPTFGQEVERVLLVVSATTSVTTEPAPYRLAAEQRSEPTD